MRGWLAAVCFAVCVTVCLQVFAAETPPPPDTITWVAQDMPPHFSFVHGRPPQGVAELGRGEVDGFLRVLLPRMRGYRHEFVDSGTSRYEMESRRGRTLCSALHVRTPERLQWAYFSHPFPPLASRELHVVVRREVLDRLAQNRGQEGRLQLAVLLKHPELRLLVARDRAFGPQIDSLLARQPVTRLVMGGRPSTQVLDMLRAGRMDYTLEYPSVVADYLDRVGEPGALVTLPVAEGRSTLLATVSCSRTPQGRRYIEAIDTAVRELARDPDRQAWLREWRGGRFDPQDLRRVNGYMDERARGGARIE